MPGQLLNLFLKLAVYSDGAPTLFPKLRDVDWDRQFEGVPSGDDFDRRVEVPPASSVTVATTARALTQDATTQYTVSQPDPDANTFRYRWTGGTNPTLRTARTPGDDVTTQFTVTRVGSVVRFAATGGTIPNFVAGGTVVGDTLNIEATTPGNVSPFNPLNQGEWTIVTVATTYVEVLNRDGVPEGPITLGTRADGLPVLSAYSAAGVQDGDEARVTSTAFNIQNRESLKVTKITSLYFDVSNASPGAPEGPITLGAADGIVFYPSLWRWIYVESDQRVSVRINGDTSDHVEVEPVVLGSPDDGQKAVGIYLQHGNAYTVVIANNGIFPADCKVILAE
jgi:hypothetical protein